VSFRVRERGPRRGRNPKTGDPVDIPAKRVPYFKPGKFLKEMQYELSYNQICQAFFGAAKELGILRIT
jgi:integration host factor subunit beta